MCDIYSARVSQGAVRQRPRCVADASGQLPTLCFKLHIELSASNIHVCVARTVYSTGYRPMQPTC